MKKWVYIIGFFIVFVFAIFVGKYIYKTNNKNINNTLENEILNNVVIQEKDYSVKNDITIQTTTEEEKISPNATLILKKHYQECGHTIKEYAEIPEDFVNLTEEQLQKEYPEWKIESFGRQEIILIKEEEGVCNEHYLLKERDGVIVVYKLNKKGEKTLIEITGISTQYLTENDKMKIKDGIKVYGKEELNSTLEDYE